MSLFPTAGWSAELFYGGYVLRMTGRRRNVSLIAHPREGKGQRNMIRREGHLCKFVRATIAQTWGGEVGWGGI